MTKRQPTRRPESDRNPSQPGKPGTRHTLDPYFACLIFGAMGLGTLKLGASPRLIILWTTLLGLWLAFRQSQPLQIQFHWSEIGRGAAIGGAIGVPLVLLAFRALATAIPILFVSVRPSAQAGPSGAMIFVSLVLLAPLAEELFFRDILQRERGLWISIGLYAVAGVIFFLPTAGGFPAVLGAVSGVTAVLGILYAFLYERYGLAVTLACHTTVNLILLYIPAIVSHLNLFSSALLGAPLAVAPLPVAPLLVAPLLVAHGRL